MTTKPHIIFRKELVQTNAKLHCASSKEFIYGTTAVEKMSKETTWTSTRWFTCRAKRNIGIGTVKSFFTFWFFLCCLVPFFVLLRPFYSPHSFSQNTNMNLIFLLEEFKKMEWEWNSYWHHNFSNKIFVLVWLYRCFFIFLFVLNCSRFNL